MRSGSHRSVRGAGAATLTLALLAAATNGSAQHAHHSMADGARLQVRDDSVHGVLTVRLGPLDLPAHSNHAAVAQPPERC